MWGFHPGLPKDEIPQASVTKLSGQLGDETEATWHLYGSLVRDAVATGSVDALAKEAMAMQKRANLDIEEFRREGRRKWLHTTQEHI